MLIRTDSKYAIIYSTDGLSLRQMRGWKKMGGIVTENEDIIVQILYRTKIRSMMGARTDFFWVKGHAGDLGNEAADKLAVRGSK